MKEEAIMAVVAEGLGFSPEVEDRLLKPFQQMHVNVLVNNTCGYTQACGQTCVLANTVRAGSRTLPDPMFRAAMKEVMEHGSVAHFAIVGKEPAQSPERVRDIIDLWNRTDVNVRPASVGMITSGYGLPTVDRASMYEGLGWMAVSVDLATSGLRKDVDSLVPLGLAVDYRRHDIVKHVSAYTMMGAVDDIKQALELGRAIAGEGVDQWVLSPKLAPDREGNMESTMSSGQIARYIDALESLGQFTEKVLVSLPSDDDLVQNILGRYEVTRWVSTGWRRAAQVNGIWVVWKAPEEGYFFGVGHDGALMKRQDRLTVGGAASYGYYERANDGVITRQLNRLFEMRQEAAA